MAPSFRVTFAINCCCNPAGIRLSEGVICRLVICLVPVPLPPPLPLGTGTMVSVSQLPSSSAIVLRSTYLILSTLIMDSLRLVFVQCLPV
ncbi:hypothetical protein D3C80_1638600 [compost metagenome]